MAWFTLNLDDAHEELFFALEEISEGKRSHYCDVQANSEQEAAQKIIEALKPFIEAQIEHTY